MVVKPLQIVQVWNPKQIPPFCLRTSKQKIPDFVYPFCHHSALFVHWSYGNAADKLYVLLVQRSLADDVQYTPEIWWWDLEQMIWKRCFVSTIGILRLHEWIVAYNQHNMLPNPSHPSTTSEINRSLTIGCRWFKLAWSPKRFGKLNKKLPRFARLCECKR